MITFKTAITSDTEVIALLGRITYTESHGHFIDDENDLLAYCDNAFSIKKITEELESKNNLFHIVYVDDLPVGFSKVVLNQRFENKTEKNSSRLEKIYILNQFLPMKIGHPFLDFIIDKVKEKKATTIWLSVYIKNERGIRFYNRNQFNKIGELTFNVNGKEYDNYVLSKKI